MTKTTTPAKCPWCGQNLILEASSNLYHLYCANDNDCCSQGQPDVSLELTAEHFYDIYMHKLKSNNHMRTIKFMSCLATFLLVICSLGILVIPEFIVNVVCLFLILCICLSYLLYRFHLSAKGCKSLSKLVRTYDVSGNKLDWDDALLSAKYLHFKLITCNTSMPNPKLESLILSLRLSISFLKERISSNEQAISPILSISDFVSNIEISPSLYPHYLESELQNKLSKSLDELTQLRNLYNKGDIPFKVQEHKKERYLF